MPKVRKLSENEARTLENRGKGTRTIIAEEYDTFLADYAIGDYGEAELEANEKRLTVRNRLKAAAERRGLGISFFRTRGSSIPFRIVKAMPETVEHAVPSFIARETPVAVEEPPTRKKPGRPRKPKA